MSHDTSSSLRTDAFWIHGIFSWEASFMCCSHGHPHVILRETYSTFSEVFPSLLPLCYEVQFISFILLSWLLFLSFVFELHVVGALPSISSTWTSLYSLKSAHYIFDDYTNEWCIFLVLSCLKYSNIKVFMYFQLYKIFLYVGMKICKIRFAFYLLYFPITLARKFLE